MNLHDPSQENATPLVDIIQYERMLKALEDSFSMIISEFFDETDRFASELTVLTENKDFNGFQRLCHEIRGAASSIGFCGISTYVKAWEEKSNGGQLPAKGELPATFIHLIEETKRQENALAKIANSPNNLNTP